jgi:hypothetical protein
VYQAVLHVYIPYMEPSRWKLCRLLEMFLIPGRHPLLNPVQTHQTVTGDCQDVVDSNTGSNIKMRILACQTIQRLSLIHICLIHASPSF